MQEIAYIAIIFALLAVIVFLIFRFDLEKKALRQSIDRLMDRVQARDLRDLQVNGTSIDRSLTATERMELEGLRKLKEQLEEGISIG